jgi:outer membrane protein OmpA-like peptidoglycan-associated protein
MFSRTALALPAVCLFTLVTSGAAFSQTAPNPTQQAVAVSAGDVPIFRITVVGRTTAAINYRPRRGDTKVDFGGTALMPQARGVATVSGEQGYIQIEARFQKIEPATRFGREYLTYVLWAITPEGRATNLGEVQLDDASAKVKVTTQLQAFGLIVTAEPYFAVTQPSDVVVLENVVRDGTNGSIEVIQAKHELLQRGSYLMNQDAARLTIKAFEPGSSPDLAQARNAVELARFAGADRFAADSFEKATGLLAKAEEARKSRRGGNAVMMPARQAAQTAEDARLVGLQRQEDAFQADLRSRAQARERDATDRAQSEEARRRQADLDTQTATTARANAERETRGAEAGRVNAQRDAENADAARLVAERATVNAETARAAAERDSATSEAARLAADSARLAAERDTATADAARVAAESAQAQAEAARLAAEARSQQAQSASVQAEADKDTLRAQLRDQLNLILETRETSRGLIVNLSDVLFDSASSNLKPGAREKLAKVSGILLSHPGLSMAIEGHTDSVGTEVYNQGLSERRSESVRVYFVGQRVGPANVVTTGFGESHPVASNDTSTGRQRNRRVELVVSGDVIGRR